MDVISSSVMASMSQHRILQVQTKSKPATTSEHGTSDSLEYEANPDIPSYQSGQFMSSTVLKKIPIAKRHMDTFGGNDYGLLSRRGVMLHTERYQMDFINMKPMDSTSTSQRERLQSGLEYMESVRGSRRKKELLPHRAQFDLIMGGKQIEFEERFDIGREIQKLKAIAMPTHAKDLFHGRGIRLPSNHMSLQPRHPLPNDIEEELAMSAPDPFHHLPHRISEPLQQHLPRVFRDLTSLDRGVSSINYSSFKKHPRLPSIPARTESSGQSLYNSSTPWSAVTWTDENQHDPRISMFQERRTVSNLSARLGFPGRLHKDVIPLSRAQSQAMSPVPDTTATKQRTKFVTRGIAEQINPKKPARSIFIHQSRSSKSQEDEKVQESSSTGLESRERKDELSNAGKYKTNILVESKNDEIDEKTKPESIVNTEPMETQQLEDNGEQVQTSNKSNTDNDGVLRYDQLKKQLSKSFSQQQEKFMEEVYNLLDSMAFLGIDEFMIMNQLSTVVEGLSGSASEAFETLDFTTLPQVLKKYVGQYKDNDNSDTGKISLENFRKILSNTITPAFEEDQMLWDKTLESITLDYSDQVSKVVFIAHIPLFLNLEIELADL